MSYRKGKASEVPSHIPDKVSITFWIEPEDLLLLDRLCSMADRSRGSIIRGLLCDLLTGARTTAQLREKWEQSK